MRNLLRWVDEQTHLVTLVREFMEEPLAERVGWPHVFGSAVLFCFLLQLCTGVLLMVYYAPSPDTAYESTFFITHTLPLGDFVRSLHHWGASFMLVVLVLHMLQTFFWGAYKRPRQIIWVIGVFLLLVVFGLSFTGYLLPWDQKAYWATEVGTRIAGSVPAFGHYITALIRGGSNVGALALSRFFAVHVVVFPLCLIGLIVFHVAQVRAKGITPPWLRVGEETRVHKPQVFYPDQVFKDVVAAVGVLALLFVVAAIHPAVLEAKADPVSTHYVPRPEWYFLPNFELLRHIPTSWGQWGEFVGAMVLPGLGIVTLIVLPYADRNPERRPSRRPFVCVAALAVLGTLIYLGLAGASSTPKPPQLTSEEARGQKIFLDRRCSMCHGINGGGGIKGHDLAPDGPRDPKLVAETLRDPTRYHPRSIMPPVRGLTPGQFNDLVAFVSSISKHSQMPTQALVGPRRPDSHQDEEWLQNHQYEVRKDPSSCKQCHQPSFCQTCHKNRLPDSHLHGWLKAHFGTARARPEYCEVCHEKSFCNSCHSRVMHTKTWMHDHPKAAHTDRDLCNQCHKPDFCITCHTGARPKSHTSGWLHEHPQHVQNGDCSTCHTADFCSDCHKGARPTSHQQGDWVKTHGEQAKADTQQCTTCHEPQFCLACHGTQMPHPQGWVHGGHQKAVKQNPALCTRCHDTRQQAGGFCYKCHGTPMPHPSDWVLKHKDRGASFKSGAVCFRCHTYQNKCAQCHGDKPPSS